MEHYARVLASKREQTTWILVITAALLLVGCSMKSVSVDSTEEQAGARKNADTLGRQPLTGFSKTPNDESVSGGLPLPAGHDQAEGAGRPGGKGRNAQGNGIDVFDVYFPFDRWGLLEEERKALIASAEFLRAHPKAHVSIEGYCDDRGAGDYNLVLGEKRAREARQFLVDLGIRNKVSTKSYGKERPVCVEHQESCYWRNRRAHLTIEAEQ